jgi:hypothetical protein
VTGVPKQSNPCPKARRAFLLLVPLSRSLSSRLHSAFDEIRLVKYDPLALQSEFTPSSRAGPEVVTCLHENQVMTCRYAHKRVALLFTAVQTPVTARVIEWPQKLNSTAEARPRALTSGKSPREGSYASK